MGTISAQELFAEEIPTPAAIVPGLILPGLTLLVARPKIGKTWLALNLAVGVANGNQVLDIEGGAPQGVLYLALEEADRRVRARLRKMLGEAPPPASLHFAFHWPRLDQGGLERLDTWLNTHPGTRLVVVDTLVRLRSLRRQGSLYQADYAEIARFKAWADRRQIAAVLLHHTRKAESADWFNLVSGSTGLTAAADTVMFLDRHRDFLEATLAIAGRDLEDRVLHLAFHRESGTWVVLQEVEEDHLTPDRRAVVQLLQQAEAPMKLKDIAAGLGKSKTNAANLLAALVRDGFVDKVSFGRYQMRPDPCATGEADDTGTPGEPAREPEPGGDAQEGDVSRELSESR